MARDASFTVALILALSAPSAAGTARVSRAAKAAPVRLGGMALDPAREAAFTPALAASAGRILLNETDPARLFDRASVPGEARDRLAAALIAAAVADPGSRAGVEEVLGRSADAAASLEALETLSRSPTARALAESYLQGESGVFDRLLLEARGRPSASLGRLAAKTLQHHLAVAAYVPRAARTAAARGLAARLEHFDLREMDEASRRPPLPAASRAAALARRGRPLEAYEAFWSEWNPFARLATREAYRLLGGDRRPFLATLGAFVYSGVFLHALNPLVVPLLPLIAGMAVLFGAPVGLTIAGVLAAAAAAFLLLGLPVAAAKAARRR